MERVKRKENTNMVFRPKFKPKQRYGRAIQPNTLLDEKKKPGSYLEAYNKFKKDKKKK